MSVLRGILLIPVLLGFTLCLPAMAQGGTILAKPQVAVYKVELPGEKVKELVCTGDIRTRTTTCGEVESLACNFKEVKFREGIAGTVQTCKVSSCTPKSGMAAASSKCECSIRLSDCR